jgi:hypothetical protein
MSGEPDSANPHARRMKEVFDFESHPGIALVRPEIAKQLIAACKPPADAAHARSGGRVSEDQEHMPGPWVDSARSARLIDGAEDLLAALKAVEAFDVPLPCGLLAQVRAAIAKAEGRAA